eukprot:11596959-Alexandrium_andersonii.AAC.1
MRSEALPGIREAFSGSAGAEHRCRVSSVRPGPDGRYVAPQGWLGSLGVEMKGPLAPAPARR